MKSIGIDYGASALKLVCIENGKIIYKSCCRHYGNIQSILREMLSDFENVFPDADNYFVAITGKKGRLLDNAVYLSDIPAITEGTKFICPNANTVIEIGSRNARYITGLNSRAVPLFSENNQCAGGTGSFFESQMSRLGLEIEDYSEIVKSAASIPRISGRCAVFAKTDIIHRQQEGANTSDILLGLCYAMIKNFKAVIVKNLPVDKPIAICGQIAKNSGVIRAVKDVFCLSDDELIIPDNFEYASAIGAGLYAQENNSVSYSLLKTLLFEKTNYIHNVNRETATDSVHISEPKCSELDTNRDVILGIDIGSTSTNPVSYTHLTLPTMAVV